MFRIYDDVLDKQFLDYVNETIKHLKWESNHKSNDTDQTSFFMSHPTDNVLYEHIFEIFKKCEPEFEQDKIIEVERYYVNLHSYGNGGNWHQDKDHPNSISFLYYPQEWNSEWKGDTLFKSGEKIEYKQNRLGIFYGNAFHKADVHFNPENRYTIAFKTLVGNTKKWN